MNEKQQMIQKQRSDAQTARAGMHASGCPPHCGHYRPLVVNLCSCKSSPSTFKISVFMSTFELWVDSLPLLITDLFFFAFKCLCFRKLQAEVEAEARRQEKLKWVSGAGQAWIFSVCAHTVGISVF